MKQLEEIAKRHNWWIGEAPAYLVTTITFTRAFVQTQKYFKKGYTKLFLILKEDYVWQILDKDESFEISESLLNDYLTNPKSIVNKIEAWEKDFTNFLKLGEKIDREDLEKMPTKDLINLYNDYFKEFIKLWTAPLIVESIGIYSNEEIFPYFLEQANLEKKEAYKAFAILTQPIKAAFAVDERLSFLRIVDKFYNVKGKIDKSSQPKLLNELKTHANSFYYVRNSYKETKKLTAEDFLKEFLLERKTKTKKQVLSELKSLSASRKTLDQEKTNLIKKLKLDKELVKILEGIALLGWWQDERKKMNIIGNYYVLLFVEKIAKRLGIPFKELSYAFPEELSIIKSKEDFLKTLKKRRSSMLIFEEAGKPETVIYEEEVNKLSDMLLPSKKFEEFKIEGMVAARGREPVVSGIVRIVLDPHKDEFNEGEILVTSMTRPEFTPLIRKSKGVITNEGGITCHAAIIAREFEIPCIVGTKKATAVLKNNERVEMKMNHGTVQKLIS